MIDWAIGLSTGCFHDTGILEALDHIQSGGFGLIEICSAPRHFDYRDSDAVHRVSRRIEKMELNPYSFHAPFADEIDITSFDTATRERAVDEIIRAAEAADILGVKYFVLHPGPEKSGFPVEERLGRMENAALALNQVAHRCRELGIFLVLENMLPHLFSGHIRDMLWLMGSLRTTEMGICLDTGHAYLSGDLENVAHKLSGHLWMIHASDTHGQYDDHLPAGDGKVPWAELLGHLAASNFRGAFILEIHGRGGPEEIMADARRGRSHLREIARTLHPVG